MVAQRLAPELSDALTAFLNLLAERRQVGPPRRCSMLGDEQLRPCTHVMPLSLVRPCDPNTTACVDGGQDVPTPGEQICPRTTEQGEVGCLQRHLRDVAPEINRSGA